MKLILLAGILAGSLLATYPLASAATANLTGYYGRPGMALLPSKLTSQSGTTVKLAFKVEGAVTESLFLHVVNANASKFVVNYKVVIKEQKQSFRERALQTVTFSNTAVFNPNTDAKTRYVSWPTITLHDGSVVVPSTLDEAKILLFDVNFISFLSKSQFERGTHLIFAEVTASWTSDLVKNDSVTKRTFIYQLGVDRG